MKHVTTAVLMSPMNCLDKTKNIRLQILRQNIDTLTENKTATP